MREYHRCVAEHEEISVEVPSRSRAGVVYEVTGRIDSGSVRCSCPAFKFSGTCKHTRLKIVPCGWDSATSAEAQTMAQKENRECPLCGSRTVKYVGS